MDNWLIESLRLTTFHESAFDVKNVDWWRDVVGEEPEVSEVKLATFQRQESARFNEGQLICSVSANRVDWLLSSQMPLEGENGGLGQFPKAISEFSRVIDAWLQSKRAPVTRIALGGVAYLPVASKEDGYKALQAYLPHLQLDPVNSSDLNYRINRPRLIEVDSEELLMNRVGTWSVRRLEFSAEAAGMTKTSVMRIERATCEFDINSDATRASPIGTTALGVVKSKAVEFAGELLVNGDRA